jgi:hypothetical protein
MENSQNGQFEKRECSRIDLEAKVTLKTSEAESMILGWIQNISHGGFKLKADTPLILKDYFHVGDEVLFEAYEDFFKLKGKGQVRWTSTNLNEVGIKFDELDNRGKESLEDFLGMF